MIDRFFNSRQKDEISNKIWIEDWNMLNENNEGWEYSLNWGREFSFDKRGCFVRRRKWVQNFAL